MPGGVGLAMENAKQTLISFAVVIFGLLAFAWLIITTAVPAYEMRAAFIRIMAVVYPATVAIIIIVTIGVAIGTVAGVLFTCWTLYNRGLIWHSNGKIARARAGKEDLEARLVITVAPPGHQIIVSEVGGLNIVHKPLHLAAGKVNGAPVVHTEEERRAWLYFQKFQSINHGHTQRDEILQLPAPEAMPELLSILNTAQRVLIVGPSNSGKTTLLQWIASQRNGAVVVIDTQAYPDKWNKARVIGAGSNHVEVGRALDNLIELMVKRYKEISEGLVREGEHPKLTVIIDEWMAIVYQCQNATDTIMRLLTESRKAAMSIVIGSHSDRVKSLGLDGRGDLRDGFLIVRLWEDEDGTRKATYDYGRGERACRLPGRFELPQESNLIEIEAITTEPALNPKDAEFVQLVNEGMTKSAACWQVYSKSFSGPFSQKLNRMLSSFSGGGDSGLEETAEA